MTPGMKALSVADGEGRNSVWLAEEGLDVTATEISPVGLHKAQRLGRMRQVTVNFVLADILTWEWPAQEFDVVVAVFIQFLAPAERAHVFELMQRSVKPEGLLMLHGYTPMQVKFRTGGPSAVENLYTPEMLAKDFASMDIIELRDYEDTIEEGCGHLGHSALIDLVARRPA